MDVFASDTNLDLVCIASPEITVLFVRVLTCQDLVSFYIFVRIEQFFLSYAALVHPDNHVMGFLTYSAVDALLAVELNRGEFLLVFQTLAIYVDSQGRKCREREIMYPSIPIAVSK